MKIDTSLGPFLKRLRERNELSLRQVAKEAGVSSGYLSQIEGGKRGRRKGGDHFAPHPQILQKLAMVYHIKAYELFERAGFFEEGVSFYRGFSEERETDRCFDFVIHDPALKDIFTLQDKRAVIDRYEAQTGRKLLSWTVHPSPMRKKSTFQGLRLEGDRLYADSAEVALTVPEVAEELGMTEAVVRELVAKKRLLPRPRKGEGPLTFSRFQLLGFQSKLQHWGLQFVMHGDAEDTLDTPEAIGRAEDMIIKKSVEEARHEIRAGRKSTKARAKNGGGGKV